MILVDTSVWISVLRDKSGASGRLLNTRLDDDLPLLTRFSQLELLQGTKNEREWNLLNSYLDTQFFLDPSEKTWSKAARIYFELRRKGITVGSPIDCCIAQMALEADLMLLHQDSDFIQIATIRPLQHEFFNLAA